ncbi:class I SAM-dependent methyltransferase [Candidatus Falkowbacteria bacterium]|nr:class I SAM-dependent methyltransferase [Candidatus Falkowbacteria bacterium]
MANALENNSPKGAGISPDFYAALGLGLDTRQGIAYAATEKLIKKYCHQARIALNYGSGTGRSTRFLKQIGLEKVIGVDVAEAMLKKAGQQEMPGVSYQLISSGTLPFKDSSFDLAFSGIVLLEIPTEGEIRKILTTQEGDNRPRDYCFPHLYTSRICN